MAASAGASARPEVGLHLVSGNRTESEVVGSFESIIERSHLFGLVAVMTASERLDLIRAKCRHQPIAPPEKRHKKGLIVRGSGKPTHYGIGPGFRPVARDAAWLAVPVEREAKDWQPKPRRDGHWLNKVADKWSDRHKPIS